MLNEVKLKTLHELNCVITIKVFLYSYKVYFSINYIEKTCFFFRSIGSDISAGQCLLDEKTEIGPFEIALLCSVGCEELCVYE